MYACFWTNDHKVINLLITHGADVNEKNNDGYTALIYACKHRDYEIIKLLIRLGVNLSIKNKYGYTALMYARNKNDYKIINLLSRFMDIDKEIDIDIDNKDILIWTNTLLSINLNINLIYNIFEIHKHNLFIEK